MKMPHQLFLNHLSVVHSFHNLNDFEVALEKFLDCLDYIAPASRAGAFEIVYDESFEQNVCLTDGTVFSAAINKIKNRDLRTLWYLYTRSIVSASSDDKVSVELKGLASKSTTITADLSSEVVVFFPKWLSFEGLALFAQKIIKISESSMKSEYEVENTVTFSDFASMWPKFEASPKHGKTGYYLKNEYISPMPLSDEKAQSALLLSIGHNGERFVRFETVVYRFLKTHIDRNIYHGFVIEQDDCPISV